MKSIKNSTGSWKLVLWIALAVLAVAALILFSGGSTATGVLIPQVLDGDTDLPLEGCTVVIPETGAYMTTDAEGKTPQMTLPATPEDPVNGMPQKDWNEITILVYKDGYIPYALFHVQVWEDVSREGPKIYMFPDDGSTDGRAFSIIEGPDRGWVETLIDKYAPAE